MFRSAELRTIAARWLSPESRRWLLSAALGCLSAHPGAASSPAEGIEFFESKIRPVLVDHCYSCHSQKAERVRGGLLVDTREGLLKGGDSGPALVSGNPDQSLLIKAVRYTDENLKMPPKGKRLNPEHIEALETWVRLGAPDPRHADAPPAAETPLSHGRADKHWAFQPVTRPPLPEVQRTSWVKEPIDAFVLARLEAKGLTPSQSADKRALIRRLTFDLTGLPPSPADVRRFVADPSPEALARLVDRLLASTRYGERWARHWLDVARYADTKGYVFEEERRYPYAYTYRDYVIRAFNEDLPFDQFVVQQLAADQLPLDEDKRALAAMGYLTLGRRFLNNPHDIIDDRIDVVTRGMMGLTVACARCHDHKYDPISAKDYYALYGVFASSSEPEEKPLLGTSARPELSAEYLEEHQRRAQELSEFRTQKEAEVRAQLRQSVGEYLLAARDTARLADKTLAEGLARERKLDPGTVQRWVERLEVWKQTPFHPVFAPWFALADCPDDDLSEDAAVRLRDLWCAQAAELNPVVRALFREAPGTIREAAERYGRLFSEVDQMVEGLAPLAAPLEPPLEELREILYASDSPTAVPEAQITRLFDVPSIQKLRALKRRVEELDATHPGAPPRAMALRDNPTPQTPRVFIRGNPGNRGPEVPRQFLSLLAGPAPRPFEKGSGRLELAQAIASPLNPLTARVLVNRVWLHHFGVGLVRTPSDFGLRSDPPSHPELLDYLADRFMREGWSLKKLHRWIVLSSTYQQASADRPEALRIDPGNQLLWKMNRRRLDFEATRDALLAVSSRLDLAAGGHSVDLTTAPFTTRRTVYGFVERQNLPGLFRTFDFASPDTTSPQRFSTTVPQQALFMINSPFVVEQARQLIQRTEVRAITGQPERVESLYQLVYQRRPRERERELAVRFIQGQQQAEPFLPEQSPWQYGFGQFDPAAERLIRFQALPHFSGDAWQGGPKVPDEALGWAFLKATGGHPGEPPHAVVRRWVAPRDMIIGISGTLVHESRNGDGVQAVIIAGRSGTLGAWTVKNTRQEIRLQPIAVSRGETLDFLVGCGANVNSDGFRWAPVIKVVNPEADAASGWTVEWDARQDFSGPQNAPQPLGAWERYAQVLLMSNEFVFLD